MGFSQEAAALYERDLARLAHQIGAFPDEATVWQAPAGITNSPGNLVLHLEGNLHEYIGRQLGGHAYQRQRPLEFSTRGISRVELKSRVEAVRSLILPVISGLTEAQLDEQYPEDFSGVPLTVRHALFHLSCHLNWHLGQIDSLRRVLTEGPAVIRSG